jgi:hypothetical protein
MKTKRAGIGFARFLSAAKDFQSKEYAGKIVSLWNDCGITMPMENGTRESWHHFYVEEWNGRVLIYAIGPFLYDKSQPEHHVKGEISNSANS